jgi:hypothetical protein
VVNGGTLVEREQVEMEPVLSVSSTVESTPEIVVQPAFQPVYRPEDDTYCWMCGAAVEKRHCKIICLSCGFTRDCSDP